MSPVRGYPMPIPVDTVTDRLAMPRVLFSTGRYRRARAIVIGTMP